jgi:hypothetical protein
MVGRFTVFAIHASCLSRFLVVYRLPADSLLRPSWVAHSIIVAYGLAAKVSDRTGVFEILGNRHMVHARQDKILA